ncbi:SAM11 protein, partial [Chloropsis hardwickii]|nr:SAM11 protein [Chloropsis hardwickii]
PPETSQTPVLEEVAQMTPEEHYRRMMSALNEHGAFEEQQQQQQRLYQLANSMAVPSHGGRAAHGALLPRGEGWETAPSPGVIRDGARALWSLQVFNRALFSDSCREISHPPPLLSPQNAPHIALGPHLRPPFLGVPSALCQTPGERSGDAPGQPGQGRGAACDNLPCSPRAHTRFLCLPVSAGLPSAWFRSGRSRFLGCSSVRAQLPPWPCVPCVRVAGLWDTKAELRCPFPPGELALRQPRVSAARNNPQRSPLSSGRKASQPRAEPPNPGEAREARARDGAQDCNDEEMKDSESDAEAGEDKAEGLKAEGGSGAELKECKDGTGKACEAGKEPSEASAAAPGVPCSSSSAESPSHLLGPGVGKAEVKYLPPASLPAPQPLPFGFPYTMSPYFHAGEALGLCWKNIQIAGWLLSLWDFNDLSEGLRWALRLALCVPQVFREQAIDGETLPLLTEEHLLNNMGLKLGPALKIRSQVGK